MCNLIMQIWKRITFLNILIEKFLQTYLVFSAYFLNLNFKHFHTILCVLISNSTISPDTKWICNPVSWVSVNFGVKSIVSEHLKAGNIE